MQAPATRTLAEETYVSLTTLKRSGEAVSTPVWVMGLGDGRLAISTGADSWKVKRARRDPRVMLQPCDRRGNVTPGSNASTGTAEVVLSGGSFEETLSRLRTKYALAGRLMMLVRPLSRRSYAVLLVRLDGQPQPKSD